MVRGGHRRHIPEPVKGIFCYHVSSNVLKRHIDPVYLALLYATNKPMPELQWEPSCSIVSQSAVVNISNFRGYLPKRASANADIWFGIVNSQTCFFPNHHHCPQRPLTDATSPWSPMVTTTHNTRQPPTMTMARTPHHQPNEAPTAATMPPTTTIQVTHDNSPPGNAMSPTKPPTPPATAPTTTTTTPRAAPLPANDHKQRGAPTPPPTDDPPPPSPHEERPRLHPQTTHHHPHHHEHL